MGTLDGLTALVTGAASQRGMGRGIVLGLAEAGADVVVTDIGQRSLVARAEPSNWRGLASVVEEVEALGRKAISFEVDVREESQIKHAVAGTIAHFGHLDIVVNVAGAPQEPLVQGGWETTEEDWNLQIAVNLTGPFLVCRNAIPHMIERGYGRIINISSLGGKKPIQRRPAYTASKHGMLGLTRTFAVELASRGITANTVLPGAIATDRKWAREDPTQPVDSSGNVTTVQEMTKREVPAGYMGKPVDIANLVTFLASPASAYLTGQSINVDGGWWPN